MKSYFLICLISATYQSAICAQETSFLDTFIMPYRFLRILQHNALTEQQTLFTRNEKYQERISDDVKFPCPTNNTKSEYPPESVHKLRPGDINVIGAIGDSLTAGVGLTSTSLINLGIEHRGLSFSEGGQSTWREFLTLPNILKVFNPNLVGYSLKPSLSIDKSSQFNVAETGAISADTPHMAKVLIRRIKNDPRVNFETDWKMINIFIGANDFCTEICYADPPESILDRHKEDLLKVLRTLRDNLPRTFVNLIPPPDVQVITKFKGLPNECRVAHSLFCPCIVGLVYRKFSGRYADVIEKWRQLEVEVANYEEFDRDDFQVVAQPFFVNFTVPTTGDGLTDFTYFAADCFHFSQKGGAMVANMFWNSLLQPFGKKQFAFENRSFNLNCPSEATPYLFTKRNSAKLI